MFKSLIFGDSPGFCSTSIASSSHGATILHSGKFHIFFSLVIEVSNQKLDITIVFSVNNYL